MSTTASRVIKNTSWLYLKIVVNMFITLFTTRLILEGLGAADYGLFTVVGGSITMLGFLNSTMANVTQRFMNYYEGQGDKEKQIKLFNVSIILHAGIAFFVALLLTVAGYFFFHGVLSIPDGRQTAAISIYICLVLSTLFGVLTSPYEAVLNAHENMKYFAIISIFENILKLLVAYICIWVSYDKLIVYGSLMAAIPSISLTIMRIYCHKKYDECIFSPKSYYSKTIFKEMVGFAGWNFWTATSSLIASQGLGIILNSFYGVLLSAAQGIANQVGGALNVFSSNALKALNPILAKSEGAGERDKLHYVTLLGSRLPSMILGLFAVPLLFIIPEILDIWLVDVPQWAILFTRLMIIRNLVELPFRSLGTAIYAQGDIKVYSIVNSVINIAPLVFVYLCYNFGAPPYALYIVWIVFCIIGGMNLLYFCHRLTGFSVSIFFKKSIIPLGSIVFISVSIYVIPDIVWSIEDTAIRLMLSVASLIVYSLLSIKYIFSAYEKLQFSEFIKQKFTRR